MDGPNSRDYILTNDALKMNSNIQNFIDKKCVEIEELILKTNDGIETQWAFNNKKCSNIADRLDEMKSYILYKSHLLLDIIKIKYFV